MGRGTSAREVAAEIRDAEGDELARLRLRYADDPRSQVRRALASADRRERRLLAERARVSALYDRQTELGGTGLVLGVDEVGRGALAGPLTVCAVALPSSPLILGLNDSKQLTPARREKVAARVRSVALAVGTCHVRPADIDAWGMARALREAMAGAIQDAGVEPDCVLIDGNPVHVHPRERCVVKGDATLAAVAAASVVAKVTRDALMRELDAAYPDYAFARNKGYGSAEHVAAIRRLGLTPVHRVSFCGNFMEPPSLF